MSTERFDVTLSPAPRETMRLLYISKSRFGGDWHSTLHSHSCTELFYCLKGAGRFNIEGQLLPVQLDDLIIVNPQVEHTELSLNSNPLEYIVLGISGIELLFGSGDKSYALLNLHSSRDTLRFLLLGLLNEVEYNLDGCETVCQDLLEVLLIRLVRSNNVQVRLESTPVKLPNRECAVVKRYIDENFKENLSLDSLAKLAHINKYYLAHSFQKEYGESPIAYLVSRRLEESKYLLRNTDHSLAQISTLLGFSSPSYFSQCFRKSAGESPRQYRQRGTGQPAAHDSVLEAALENSKNSCAVDL